MTLASLVSQSVAAKGADDVDHSKYMIELGAVAKSYNGNKILHEVSLRVERGEVCSIIGPSGAGKSTLLRCINLLEQPDDGNMVIDGQFVDFTENLGKSDLMALRRKCGMVFQQFNLFPHMSALKNVVFPQMHVLGRSKEEAEERAMELLKRVGLEDRADHKPSQLSGGQQQRVAIARALALDPAVMLFDEPTSALDPEVSGEVLNVMRELAEGGMTMCVVTHEMSFARDVGDHLVVMANGSIIDEGDPKEIMAHPVNERTRQFLSAVNR
ncbi:glutamine ABC transporter ATP-binding protein [Bifidobacterium simiarum]|uniref:ABC-type polar-amino-acid transporter n=2 Tax=Bifidobacterium simiarum TaxID=2045441 RepID=A0A2M9HCV6_9BIFI|nr:amino acid ABC transporter ATP-binding protein [Bifidobacterium simiarum]PJM74643.1 glutamine ABC transporter ATP-binding protein [Bifidobacterium simiarum]